MKLSAYLVPLRRALVILVPVIIMIVAFFWFIQPRMAAARVSRAQLEPLELQLASVQATVSQGVGVEADAVLDVMPEFESLTPTDARVHELLEQIANTFEADVDADRVRNLVVDTGLRVDRTQTADTPGLDPFASSEGDPRLDLFPAVLSYTSVTVTFEGSYARLGQFLWELRNLPLLTEIRTLVVEPAAGGSVQVRLELYAYQRSVPRTAQQDPELAEPTL